LETNKERKFCIKTEQEIALCSWHLGVVEWNLILMMIFLEQLVFVQANLFLRLNMLPKRSMKIGLMTLCKILHQQIEIFFPFTNNSLNICIGKDFMNML